MIRQTFLLLFISIAYSAYSQTNVGFRLGMLRSKISVSNFQGQEFLRNPIWVTGVRGGFFFETCLFKNLYINPEIGLVWKGGKYDAGNITIGEVTGKAAYESKELYAELPINLLLKIPVNEKGKVLLAAGAVGGAFISGNIKYDIAKKTPGGGSMEGFKSSLKDAYEQFEMGLNFAVGYEYKNLRTQFNIRPDFSDVSRIADIEQRNFYMSLNLGISFGP